MTSRAYRRVALAWPVAIFLVSVALVLATDAAQMTFAPPLLRHAFGFFDLKIYREAAGVVLGHRPLYQAHFRMGFGFTYPPFAALTFLGLQALPLGIDECLVTAVNLALVVVLAHLACRLTAPDDPPGPRRRAMPWLLAALGLWTEPVITAIGYGQIDLVVAALVWFDLVVLRGTRRGGIGIGLAAALKLTPLVFLPYLALTGSGRSAWRSLRTFLGTIVLSFVIVPQDAWGYWGRALFDTGRVTGHRPFAGRGPADQSLRGLLLRLAGTPHIGELWLAVCLVVGAGGLWLAVHAHRRGDDSLGCVLMAVTGLLICPVSWTHHWVIALPGLVLLARLGRGWGRLVGVTAAVTLAAGSSEISLLILSDPEGARLDFWQLVSGDLYVLAGLATLALATGLELRRALSRRSWARASPGDPGGQLRTLTPSRIPTGIGQSNR